MTPQEILDFKSHILTRPDSFALWSSTPHYDRFFKPDGWGFTGMSQTRDSSILDTSNWEVIIDDLLPAFPDTTMIIRCSHFLCGWIDHLAIDTSDTKLLERLYDYSQSLSDYPILNENHYADMQAEVFNEHYLPTQDPETERWEHDFSDQTFTTERAAIMDAHNEFIDSEASL